MKIKIAIVEDDRIIAEDLKRTLLTLGYRVTGCFSTGQEAVQHAQEKQPDLVLMDIMLRGPLDGIETAQKIQEQAEIPIIYLTAYTDQEILRRAKLTNPYGYLVKPFKTRELHSNIEMALHKNRLDRQVKRLQSILLAIRNVNQLIANVDNQDELLQRTCEELVTQGGYKAVWIGLVNDGQQLIAGKGAGFNENFEKIITEIVRKKQLPPCAQKVLKQQDELIITNKRECSDCPLSNSTSVEKMVVVRLEYQERIHGFLCANLPRYLTIEKAELSLIGETAEDMANALNKLYLEKEHTKALLELKESENKYRLLVETSPDAVVMTDLQGNITFISPRGLKLYGASHPEDVMGQNIFQFIDPKDREEVMLGLETTIAQGELRNLEYGLQRKDGRKYICSMNVMLVRDVDENPIAFISTIRDITEHKRSERERAVLRTLSHRLTEPHSLEQIGKIVAEEAYRLFEYDAFSLDLIDEKQGLLVGIHCEDTPTNKKGPQKVPSDSHPLETLKQDAVIKGEGRIINRDRVPSKSELAPFGYTNRLSRSLLFVPIIWKNKTIGTLSVQSYSPNKYQQKDLTLLQALANQGGGALLRAQAQQKLIEAEERYRSTIESMREQIYIIDTRGTIIDCYLPETHIGIGYNKEDILQKKIAQVFPPQAARTLKKSLAAIKRGAMSREFEYSTEKKSRTFWFHSVVSGRYVNGKLTGITVVSRDITKRKESENSIKTLQSFNEGIINSMSEGLAVIDLDGKMVFINPTAEKMLGYELGELRGKSWKKIVTKNYQRVVAEVDKQRERGLSNRYELKLKRKDGVEVDVLVSGSPRFEKGQFQGTMAVFTDISDRKKAEEALKASEYKYRTLVENSILGMAIYTPGQPYTYCNRRLAEITGYSIGELEAPGFKFSDLFSPSDKEIIQANTEKRLAGETIPPYILPITTKQGQQKWIEIDNVLLKSGQQATVQMQILDVTERLHVERKLIESEKKYRELFEDSLDAIYVTSKDGQFLDVNKATTKLLNYSKEELLKMKARDLAVTEQNHRKFIATLITNGTVTNYPFSLRKKDGSQLQCLLSAKVLRDKNGDILEFQGIIHDVTRQVELEEQLRQAIKLEGIGRLAGGIAHDFNNILTGIIGYSDLALASLPKNHPLKDSLEMIVKKADDAASLIRQLLAFSRKQILNIQPTDLNHVILQSSKFLKRVLRDNITLELTLDPNPCVLEADHTALQQILTNLCINGQDAISDQGVIFLETAHVDLDEEFCRTVENASPGHYVRCTITDTGSGMNAETLSHIFEPFFTTKDVGEGTGLGLATVYGLVRQQKGIIQCISKEGKGTSFNIFFPAAPEQWQTQMENQKTRQLYRGKETILLIEDDVDVLNVMRNILEYSGYTVLIAKDGLAGLDLIKTKNQEIDLLITDLVMPGLSGLELINKMKHLGIKKKVILITGYATQDIQKELDPAVHIMRKPITSNQLTKTIRELLEGTLTSS